MDQPSRNSRSLTFFGSPKGKRVSLWLTFFLFWGGAAAILPYIALYFEGINLSGRQIGQLTSIPFFITLISSVIFGFLSDITKKSKFLLRICSLGMIIVLFIYPQAGTFTSLIPIVLLYSILHAPANPIIDQTTLNALENPELYGRMRVGGSIGWGVMVLVTGFLIDNLKLGISAIFYINIFFMVLFFFTVGLLPTPTTHETLSVNKASLKKITQMILKPGFVYIFLLIIVWGIGEASISNFLFLHIKHLGGSSTLMGTALSISLIGEIVTFSLANKIQVKIGELRMILLAFFVLIVWLTGLSLIKDPSMIPFFQVFGGAGFALMQSGSVAYVNKRAPKELATTAQALRGGIYAGFGNGVGALLSGILYEFVGSSLLFRVMSLVQLCGLLMGVIIYSHNRKEKVKKISQ